jgi:hypothetical protein
MKHLRVKLSIFLLLLAVSLVASSSAYGQATVTIQPNDLSNVGFNDPTPVAPVGGNNGTTLGQQRFNAVQHAANLWGATLNSGTPITIRANWQAMSCEPDRGSLASAGTTALRQNFLNAPFSGTWYPVALANALTGSDTNPGAPEINARFNISIGTSGCLTTSHWYLGLDRNHGFNGINLVTVALHEFAHGLGFQSFTDEETGNFSSGTPSIWDRFLRDNSSGKLWVEMTAAERVASAKNNGNLVWAGPQVTAGVPSVLIAGADTSNRVRMFAPTTLDSGSSVSHFDKSASRNLLMEPAINVDLTHTLAPPNDLTLPLLRDIGWQAVGVVPTPTPSPPPNDNFAAAQVISGCAGTVSGTNSGATRESNERDHADSDGNSSVWYRWQAPVTGSVNINTQGSGFDTVLAVYVATSVNSLPAPVIENDDQTPVTVRWSTVDFQAQAGSTYHIAVDGFNNGGGSEVGPITLTWNQTGCSNPAWTPTTLNATQVQLKSWKNEGRTFVYAKLTFPDAGFRVNNWGTAIRAGNAFSADAVVERFNGISAQAISNTAQIWDLGVLSAGNYTFAFRNSGTTVKTLDFTVSSTVPPPNPIDNAEEFVRWQYRDFLRREPDTPGLAHWTAEITQCSDVSKRLPGETVAQCVDRKRENTSAAFFLSPEFQNMGYFVLRVYRGTLGRMPHFGGGTGPTDEFTRDAATISQGIVVNDALVPATMNANKQAFVNAFVTRAEFRAIYDGLSATQFVDKLSQTTGVPLSSGDRAALINEAGANRASVVFKVVDGTTTTTGGQLIFNTTYGKAFYDSQFNAAFVQMEYFGYLQRDPDPAGYAFWLSKLNSANNWGDAEMVRAFIVSPEYRARFGAP